MSDPTKTASVRVQLVLGYGFFSWLIAFFGGAGRGFSHVDLWHPAKGLLGARADRVGGQPPGIHYRPYGYEPWRRRVVFEIPCTPVQAALFWSTAEKYLGWKYNDLAILGFVLGRRLSGKHEEICSQFFTVVAFKSTLSLKPYFPFSAIDPDVVAYGISLLGGYPVEHDEMGKKVRVKPITPTSLDKV